MLRLSPFPLTDFELALEHSGDLGLINASLLALLRLTIHTLKSPATPIAAYEPAFLRGLGSEPSYTSLFTQLATVLHVRVVAYLRS